MRLSLPPPLAAPQVHALVKREALRDVHWPEASELIVQLEALAEDAAFPARQVRGSAVAARVCTCGGRGGVRVWRVGACAHAARPRKLTRRSKPSVPRRSSRRPSRPSATTT